MPAAAKTRTAAKAKKALTGKAALIQVLSKNDGPMRITDLTKAAAALVAKNGGSPKGATPLATLASTVYVEAKKDGGFCRKVERGTVQLNPDFQAWPPAQRRRGCPSAAYAILVA